MKKDKKTFEQVRQEMMDLIDEEYKDEEGKLNNKAKEEVNELLDKIKEMSKGR